MSLTLAEVKTAYPDLVEQIEKTGYDAGLAAGIDQGRAEGIETGARAERERIQAVEAQGIIPGHEALINTLKFDGTTTGPEAAVQILAAEKVVRETKLTAVQTDTSSVVVPTVDASAKDAEREAAEKAQAAEAAKPASERLQAIVTAKMAADPALSYATALVAAQKENKDLAAEVAAEISAARLPA
jgi:capsid assembly protease